MKSSRTQMHVHTSAKRMCYIQKASLEMTRMYAGNKSEDGVVCDEVKSVFAARAPAEEEALKLYLSNSKEFVRRWRALGRYCLRRQTSYHLLAHHSSSLHITYP